VIEGATEKPLSTDAEVTKRFNSILLMSDNSCNSAEERGLEPE
jgi:hypothetical protein